ncbi:MAG: hypothetical protein R2864_01920 [Syntrophotaleaceae bacterium]
MRKGYREQTKGLVDMMKQDSRRTDLEIVDSVKRYYYGAVLATQLHQVGKDTFGPHGSDSQSHRNHVQGRLWQGQKNRLS